MGHLGVEAFSDDRIGDPEIIELASRMHLVVESRPAPRTQFGGRIVLETTGGRRIERVQEHNRGSLENPMTRNEIEEKFNGNAAPLLAPEKITSVRSIVSDLGAMKTISDLVDGCVVA